MTAPDRSADPASPPRHLVVYANPLSTSFDHAIMENYCAEVERLGQESTVRDLYAMGFDPVLKAHERAADTRWGPSPDVAAELELIRQCDTVVLIYPIWFGLPPAILKGYVDRVLGAGLSFHHLQAQRGQPALIGKFLLSFSTSGTALEWLQERGQVLSLREIFDVYLWRSFGMRQSEHIMIDEIVPNMSSAHARQQLNRVRGAAERMCTILADDQLARSAGGGPPPRN